MDCVIVLNNLGNSEASLIRIFVLSFQMLYVMSEIILHFAQWKGKNNFLFKQLGEGDLGLFF